MDTLSPQQLFRISQNIESQKEHDTGSINSHSSKRDTPFDCTPSSVHVFESIDSLVLQYKKKLGVNSEESASSAKSSESELEKRKLEVDFISDLSTKITCTREDEDENGEEVMSQADDHNLLLADYAVGTGYFGRGIKSKMKERRRKQQLILEEFRPKWSAVEHKVVTLSKRSDDSRKRVRFDVYAKS